MTRPPPFVARVYVGPASNPMDSQTKKGDWTEVHGNSFSELKEKANKLCQSRFRTCDCMKVTVANNKYYPCAIVLKRLNRIVDNKIEIGLTWL